MKPTPSTVERKYPNLAELAVSARERPGAEAELWEAIADFVAMKARDRLRAAPPHLSSYLDDLVQSGYFAMRKAVRAFDPERGFSFFAYLRYPLMSSFNYTLYPLARKADPLMNAISIDSPVPGGDPSETFADLIADPGGEAGYDECDEAEFREYAHAFILRGLYASARGDILDVLLYMLDSGTGFTDACRALLFDSGKRGFLRSQYTQACGRFRRWCRSGARVRELQRSGLMDYYGAGIRGVSVQKFRAHNFTSSTERAAINHIRRVEKIERLSSQFG